MKEAYYFSHDSNARHDPKITAMRGVYGSEGYGWFWILVEMMRESDGYQLSMQGKYVWNAFASQMNADASQAQQFIEDCIHEFDLFRSDGSFFWSESLMKRMEKRDEKSKKAAESARKRWENSKKDANASEDNANASKNDALKERKVKEIKEKEIKDIVDANASKRFIKPTLQQVTEYCQERSNNVDPEKWYNHYESNGWKVGKNPMKNWKAAVHTWENSSKTSIRGNNATYTKDSEILHRRKTEEINERMADIIEPELDIFNRS
jgi:hypothetical protein